MSELTLLAGLLLVAGSLGCKGTGQEAPALVAYFETHGVKLAHERDRWWRVTQPAIPGFEVIVSLRSFPESAPAH